MVQHYLYLQAHVLANFLPLLGEDAEQATAEENKVQFQVVQNMQPAQRGPIMWKTLISVTLVLTFSRLDIVRTKAQEARLELW